MAFPHALPDLGYAFDALEPHIDSRTMEIHHGKHHAGYTAKLNAALEGFPDFQEHSAERLLRGINGLPEALRGAVQNNGGGYHNHSLFWATMTPGGAHEPGGSLRAALEGAFGSFDSFKEAFSGASGTRFGSGWGWLAVSPFGHLQVFSTANQDSPLMKGFTPLLGFDVWEHAYYLKYQNRRPDYVSAFWNVVNWDVVGTRYAAAEGGWISSVR